MNRELSSGKRPEFVVPLALVRQGGSPLFFSLVRVNSSFKGTLTFGCDVHSDLEPENDF